MPDEIELRARTNKDLLIMTVMQGNEHKRHLEKINGTMEDHEKRIMESEIRTKLLEKEMEWPNRNDQNNRLSKKQIASVGSGSIGIAAILYYLIQLLVNAYGG